MNADQVKKVNQEAQLYPWFSLSDSLQVVVKGENFKLGTMRDNCSHYLQYRRLDFSLRLM